MIWFCHRVHHYFCTCYISVGRDRLLHLLRFRTSSANEVFKKRDSSAAYGVCELHAALELLKRVSVLNSGFDMFL